MYQSDRLKILLYIYLFNKYRGACCGLDTMPVMRTHGTQQRLTPQGDATLNRTQNPRGKSQYKQVGMPAAGVCPWTNYNTFRDSQKLTWRSGGPLTLKFHSVTKLFESLILCFSKSLHFHLYLDLA